MTTSSFSMYSLAAILIVDDDQATSYLNEAALYSLRLTNTYWSAHNGEQALQLLLEHQQVATPERPILVLLDIAMPIMGGMDFLAQFNELPASLRASVVIVILAFSMSSADLAQVEHLPVAGTMSKPLVAERLTTILDLYFSARGAAGTA